MTDQSEELRKPSALWSQSERLSVVEAALLLLDLEPQGLSQDVENWDDEKKPAGYLAARRVLTAAIESKAIVGNVVYFSEDDIMLSGADPYQVHVNHHASSIENSSFGPWLHKHKYTSSAFPLSAMEDGGFKNEAHPRYSVKLAAVVEAWEEYDELSTESGTPKQRLSMWLRLNAARLGLAGEDGIPMETVIEELAKVANWVTKGGAPKRGLEKPDP